MKIVSFESESESGSPATVEWHAWRKDGIGASDAVIVAAHAGLIEPPSWAKPLDWLFLNKTGRADSAPPNAAMQRGTRGEGPARSEYERVTGNIVSPAFGEMDGAPYVRASFDGLGFADPLIVEIKCPSPRVHDLAKNGEVVEYYLPQLAHQALVAWGHPEGWPADAEVHFVSFVPETNDIAIVDADLGVLKAMADRLFPAEEVFWRRVLAFRETGRDPEVPEDVEALAKRYIAAYQAAKAAEDALEEAKSLLLGAIPEDAKRWSGAGVTITRTEQRGAVNYAELLKHLGVPQDEVDRFRKEPSIVTRIRVDD